MNIIKFKPNTFSHPEGSAEEFFNKYLSGKYAYAVHWKYIFELPNTIRPEEFPKDLEISISDSDIEANSVKVYINSTANIEYNIQYCIVNESQHTIYNIVEAESKTLIINELQSGCDYSFKIRVKDGNKYSMWKTISFKTKTSTRGKEKVSEFGIEDGLLYFSFIQPEEEINIIQYNLEIFNSNNRLKYKTFIDIDNNPIVFDISDFIDNNPIDNYRFVIRIITENQIYDNYISDYFELGNENIEPTEDIPLTDVVESRGITMKTYVDYEREGISNVKLNKDYINLDENIKQFIDEEETYAVNNNIKFSVANDSLYNDDIPIEELKQFRTWLAENIIKFIAFPIRAHHIDEKTDITQNEVEDDHIDSVEYIHDILQGIGENKGHNMSILKYIKLNNDIIDFLDANYSLSGNDGSERSLVMLNYYKSLMFDDTIKVLLEFPVTTTPVGITIQSGCDCGTSMTQAPITLGQSAICDPVATYRASIYSLMVELFSDMRFWKLLGSQFLINVADRVDAILDNHFVLSTDQIDRFVDCTCKNINSNEQERLEGILSRFANALRKIAANKESGEKNNIMISLNDWAKYLYEKMYWM